MRVGVIRIVSDGLKYFFFCFSEPALLAGGNAEIIVGNWAFRIDLERLGQFGEGVDRKSTRLNSSHSQISYAVFCLKKKKKDYYAHVDMTHILIQLTS